MPSKLTEYTHETFKRRSRQRRALNRLVGQVESGYKPVKENGKTTGEVSLLTDKDISRMKKEIHCLRLILGGNFDSA